MVTPRVEVGALTISIRQDHEPEETSYAADRHSSVVAFRRFSEDKANSGWRWSVRAGGGRGLRRLTIPSMPRICHQCDEEHGIVATALVS